jgi:CBS domain containing-hemolysin-like protein
VGIVAEPALAHLLEPLTPKAGWMAAIGGGGLLAFLVLNLVHLTHGEQTPTYLGVERTKMVARYGARPLAWFTLAIRPIIALGDKVAKATLRLFGIEMTRAWLETGTEAIESRAELRNRLSSVLDQSQMPHDRRDEVLAALDLDDTPVAEIMIPAEEMVVLPIDASILETPQMQMRVLVSGIARRSF